jgi:hypothetical protein
MFKNFLKYLKTLFKKVFFGFVNQKYCLGAKKQSPENIFVQSNL